MCYNGFVECVLALKSLKEGASDKYSKYRRILCLINQLDAFFIKKTLAALRATLFLKVVVSNPLSKFELFGFNRGLGSKFLLVEMTSSLESLGHFEANFFLGAMPKASTLSPTIMEVEKLLQLRGNDPIGDTPIFHFHDDGRKGNILEPF